MHNLPLLFMMFVGLALVFLCAAVVMALLGCRQFMAQPPWHKPRTRLLR